MSTVIIDGEEFDAVCSRCHHPVMRNGAGEIVHEETAQAAACALFYGSAEEGTLTDE